MDYSEHAQDLRIEVKDRVLTLTLDRPEHLNSSSPGMHRALSRIWDDIFEDPEVDVVVLTGAGRAFSAGGDIARMQEQMDSHPVWWTTVIEAKRIIYRMLEFDKPIVARVNGHAVGFGATLAMCCDIVVAADTAKFGDPHIYAGLVAGDGGAMLWPTRIGFARAKEYLLTGELFSAERAVEIGLINYAVPPDRLDAKVDELVQRLLKAPPEVMRLTKQVMNIPLRQSALSQMEVGMANESISNFSEDHREAVRSFLEKDEPRFKGR